MALKPARLDYLPDGTPYSSAYGDVYHTTAGGLEQARKVFIAGNQLPGRWLDREQFVVLETGFGLGLNFLATWDTWKHQPGRCTRLHYIATEKHPFKRDDLTSVHAQWPELSQFSAELRAQWPVLTPGYHRIELDGGQVILTLLFGDTAEQLAQLTARVDAIFLDGFSPAANPDMWAQPVFSELARLAAPGATLATWSVSGEVRRGLTQAGFDCQKAPGYGPKREILRGILSRPGTANRAAPVARHAIVLGAGLAGSSIAERLMARGWQITLIESQAEPGMGASGNHAGVLRPLPSLDDNRLARLTRAGSLFARSLHQRLHKQGLPIRFGECGVLHLARDPRHETKQRDIIQQHDYPDDFAQFVERDAASAIAGWPLPIGGWWFPGGGWVQPHSVCRSLLAAHPDQLVSFFNTHIQSLERHGEQWHALDDTGHCIAQAPVVILANGVGISQFEQASGLPVRSARGQVAHFSAPQNPAPATVVCRLGYVSPPVDELLCAGATFTVNDDDPGWRDSDHAENLAKLDFILPGFHAQLPETTPQGRVGFRPASPDRLPMVGALPGSFDKPPAGSSLEDIPRLPGLHAVSGFGARGLVWSAIVAENLASQLHADPLPLENDLVRAIDPARFLLRHKPLLLKGEDG